MSKYDDCHRVDNRYTTAIGMSVWRFFNVGKYKNQKVKDPEDQELILKVSRYKTIV